MTSLHTFGVRYPLLHLANLTLTFVVPAGMLFGKTQLIKLSPKKTVEGFVGAFFTTLIFGYFVSIGACSFLKFG